MNLRKKLVTLGLAVMMLVAMSTTAFASEVVEDIVEEVTEEIEEAVVEEAVVEEAVVEEAVVEEPVVEEPVIEEPVVEEILVAETVTALPTASKVLVNGEEVAFDAYNIGGNNYFKLRDVATVVNGTEKQFGVEWDNEKSAINLTSNSEYVAVGGELGEGDGNAKVAVSNSSIIYKDGEMIELETSYTINGNNYFKLRDIAKTFNIGVTWDGETNTVGIDTTIGYEIEEAKAEEIEVSIESANFISATEILVKFNKAIPASKAGEMYSALVYLDWDGMSPWEIGLNLNLVEGESELVIDLAEDSSEFELPGAGKYELFMEAFEDIRSPLEVSEELLK